MPWPDFNGNKFVMPFHVHLNWTHFKHLKQGTDSGTLCWETQLFLGSKKACQALFVEGTNYF